MGFSTSLCWATAHRRSITEIDAAYYTNKKGPLHGSGPPYLRLCFPYPLANGNGQGHKNGSTRKGELSCITWGHTIWGANPVPARPVVGWHVFCLCMNIIHPKSTNMLRWTIIFLVVAIIAAIFGFGGIAAGAAGIAKILFYIFLVLFVISLIAGRGRGVRDPL